MMHERAGKIGTGTTVPEPDTFELGVILAGTNIVSVLHDDHHAISRARTAIRTRLTGQAGWHRTSSSRARTCQYP